MLRQDNYHNPGLNLYDFHARNYDPAIGRWLNVDPLVEQTFEPYSYVGNNPVNFTDPTGMSKEDIIVLLSKSQTGHLTGHQAILVGDDKNGWTYFSLDGDSFNYQGNDQYTIANFSSLNEFANSEHNTFKNDYDDGQGLKTSERNNNGKVKQRYDQGFRIETTPEQDKKMINVASNTVKKGYNLATNNCTDVPSNALKAGGFKDGDTTDHGSFEIPYLGKFNVSTRNGLPSTKQREIEKKNLGTRVDNFLIPTE